MKKWTWMFLLVLAISLAFPAAVFAQGEEPPEQPEDSPLGWKARWTAWRFPDAFKSGSDKLAEALELTPEAFRERVKAGETPLEIAQSQGLSEEDFQALLEEIQYEWIDEALQEGKITPEKAEEMRQRVADGIALGESMQALREISGNLLADALGLPLDEIRTRIQAGERLAEIAESQGMSEETFAQTLAEVQAEALAQAVAQGLLDEEQAGRLEDFLQKGDRPARWQQRYQNMNGKEFLMPALAEQLGLDWAEIQGRMETGETWPEIMEDLGLDREDLRGAMEDLGLDILDKAQESGLLSPERAQELEEGGPLNPLRWLQKAMKTLSDFRLKLFPGSGSD